MKRIRKLLIIGSAVTLVGLAATAAAIAGSQAIRGTVTADGSSTVGRSPRLPPRGISASIRAHA